MGLSVGCWVSKSTATTNKVSATTQELPAQFFHRHKIKKGRFPELIINRCWPFLKYDLLLMSGDDHQGNRQRKEQNAKNNGYPK